MPRYYVTRAYVKWKGKMYYKGDLLPEGFTHRDRARNCYISRIALWPEDQMTQAASDEKTAPATEQTTQEAKQEKVATGKPVIPSPLSAKAE
ncbi:MAG: hypothetical protein R3Y58_01825 [Eubacteriales bacterium]